MPIEPETLQIARSELLAVALSRRFILGAVVLPLFAALALARLDDPVEWPRDRPLHVVLFDESRSVGPSFASHAAEILGDRFAALEIDIASINRLVDREKARGQLRELIAAGEVDAAIVLGEDFPSVNSGRILVASVPEAALFEPGLSEALRRARIQKRLSDAGISDGAAARSLAPIELRLESTDLGASEASKSGRMGVEVVVLWLAVGAALIMYSGLFVASCARIFSEHPGDQSRLFAAFGAAGCGGLIQTVVWALLARSGFRHLPELALAAGLELAPDVASLLAITPRLVFGAALAFCIATAVYALAAAVVSRLAGDKAKAIFYAAIAAVALPWFTPLGPAMLDPGAGSIAFAAFVTPLYTPFVLIARVAQGSSPWLQSFVAVASCGLWSLLFGWWATKIHARATPMDAVGGSDEAEQGADSTNHGQEENGAAPPDSPQAGGRPSAERAAGD